MFLLLFVTCALLLCYYLVKNRQFFADRGVKNVPAWPFIGSMYSMVARRKNFSEMLQDLYNAYPDEAVVGVQEFLVPVFLVRDPEIIREISIKDFDHFQNHRAGFDVDNEPMLGRSLFMMADARWKSMRSTLSPAFTGSKMRTMFALVNECATELMVYLRHETAHTGTPPRPNPFELKDLFTRYATDVIASCAFGHKTNSLTDRQNEFFKQGKAVTNFEGLNGFKFFMVQSFPRLSSWLRLSLISEESNIFFRQMVHGTIDYREKNAIVRPDMIHLLMQLKRGDLGAHSVSDEDRRLESAGFATASDVDAKVSSADNAKIMQWEDDDLTAQCMLFLLAGFDTVSALMCFIGYELALNPDVQRRLREEVDDTKRALNGKPFSYEVVQKMKYLDMIASETLRLWPPSSVLDRRCSKTYHMRLPDGRNVEIPKGAGLWLPAYGLHRDPKYFADPDKFDPERFSDENKDSILPGSYFPFGMGPRNCIGSRFALMETKAIIYHLISEFTIHPTAATESPLKLLPGSFVMKSRNGFWVDLQPRTDL